MGALPPEQTRISLCGQLRRALGSGISSELAHAESSVVTTATDKIPAKVNRRRIIAQL